MNAARFVCLSLLFGLMAVLPSSPAAAGCGEDVDLTFAAQECADISSSDVEAEKAMYPTAVWSARQICKDDKRNPEGLCFNPDACTTAAGVPGTRYAIFRDGENVANACLTAGEFERVDDPPPIRVLVISMFKDLDWPASDLVVEPPDGRTLVNLETNFYTTNTGFTVIPVKLIESKVRIQAEPIEYTWHFGDGTSVKTTIPGNPYPDLDVAHVYEQVDEVVVSVDTTYGNASFSVDGRDWESIDSTLVVPGAEEDLAILEAKPQLVIR